jgi:hypothetical protein
MRAMQQQYGKDHGERVFYASENKGVLTGVHRRRRKGAGR